jgi:hypothetical protein
MRRLVLCLAVALTAFATPSAATAAGGPLFVVQGGTGVPSHVHPGLRYVAVPDGAGATVLETVDVANGGVFGWARLHGSWGIPMVGNLGQGLSRDGRTLVLGTLAGPYVSSSRFLVVDPRRMKARRTVALDGAFSFDALSPDGSRLYLIQYASAGDLTHYIVRAYDLRTDRLLPGKIADRSEHEKSMAGTPMTRTTSAAGRWVYTLYQKPSGEPFVHALDTVRGAAYCIDLPENRALYNIVLSLRNGGRTLALNWRTGKPWLRITAGSWRISYPRSDFPWMWVGAGGGALVLAGAVGGALFLRRRRRSEELEQHPGQELGLA